MGEPGGGGRWTAAAQERRRAAVRTLRRLDAAGEAAAAGGAAGCRPCQACSTNNCRRGEVRHIAAGADHCLLPAAAAATPGWAALVLIYTYSQCAACESWPDRGPTLARRDRQSLTKHAKRRINVSRMLPEIRMEQMRFTRIEAKNVLMTTCSIEPLPIYKLIQRCALSIAHLQTHTTLSKWASLEKVL